MRAGQSQCSATTPHVAHLSFSTSGVGTGGGLNASLSFIGVELGHHGMVGKHCSRHLMPVRRIQWGIGWPVDGICFTGRVLELEGRSSLVRVKGSERVDIGVVCVCVVDIEVASIHDIHPVSRVEVGQWSDTGANPTGG